METPCKIMAIDDDAVANFLTEAVIKNAGLDCELFTATKVDEALEHLKRPGEECPNLILLDINMPVLDGWDFLDMFYKENICAGHGTSVVMLSSSVYQSDREKAAAYPGVVDYIEKPITVERITEIHQKHLD